MLCFYIFKFNFQIVKIIILSLSSLLWRPTQLYLRGRGEGGAKKWGTILFQSTIDIHILNIYSSLQLTYTFETHYCCIYLCCFALSCYQNCEGSHSVRLFNIRITISSQDILYLTCLKGRWLYRYGPEICTGGLRAGLAEKKEVCHGPGLMCNGPGWAARIRPMQITVCLQLYNIASINQSSARDPSMLFTHAGIKQLQNQSTTLSVQQTCLFSDSVKHIFYLHSNLYHKKSTDTLSSV